MAAEQVFLADPVVVPDASGTFATVRVATDREMACAVVFGPDKSLDGGSPRTPTWVVVRTPGMKP